MQTVQTRQSWLGPFLMKPSSNGMGFWISTGTETPIQIQIEVLKAGSVVIRVPLVKQVFEAEYGIYLGEIATGLDPDQEYSYRVQVEGSAWLPEGFDEEDLQFRTLPHPSSGAELEFFLVSCNGIEEYEKKRKKGGANQAWAMWDKMLAQAKERPKCRIAILAGDQVYMDDAFSSYLAKGKESDLTSQIQAVYRKYWGGLSYRKLLARVPSLLMWDDHDLIDGWGSRPDAYKDKKGTWKPNWTDFGKQMSTAFKAMQATRNPGLLGNGKNGFSYLYQWGDTAMLGLDLRSQRDVKAKAGMGQMLSDEHREEIDQALNSLRSEINTLFVITPVTVARMGSGIEALLGSLANYTWWLASKISYGRSLLRVAVWTVLSFIFLFIAQLNTTLLPSFWQAITLILLSSVLLLSEVLRKTKVAKKSSHSKLKIVYLGVALFGLFCLAYPFILSSAQIDRSFAGALFEKTARASSSAWDSLWWVFVVGATGTVSMYFLHNGKGKKNSKSFTAPIKIASIGGAGIFFLVIWWLGLPTWRFTIETFPAILVMAMTAMIGIALYLVAILEAFGAIDEIAGLDDDLKDAWSSEQNAHELHWLGSHISSYLKDDKKVVILTGDIHTGGLSYLKFTFPDGQTKTVPQITSSPIAYVPMPTGVERLTSGDKLVPLPEVDPVCHAYNVFYACQRNFVVVTIGKGQEQTQTLDCEFVFEEMVNPVRFSPII